MSTNKKEIVQENEPKKKISELISAYKRVYEQEQKKHKQVAITFYKGDIKHTFERKSDNRKIAIIAFPKNSIYYGFTFFYPLDWIYQNKDEKSKYPSNPDHRWFYIPEEYITDIYLSDKDNKGKYYTKEHKKLSAIELKKAMQRKRREN